MILEEILEEITKQILSELEDKGFTIDIKHFTISKSITIFKGYDIKNRTMFNLSEVKPVIDLLEVLEDRLPINDSKITILNKATDYTNRKTFTITETLDNKILSNDLECDGISISFILKK